MACKGKKGKSGKGKNKYQEMLDICSFIAMQVAPKYKNKIAESKEEAKAHGVRLGDMYREPIPEKFTPISW